MQRATRRLGFVVAILLIASAGAFSQASIGDFENALGSLQLQERTRIVAALEMGLEQPGFPAQDLLSLIQRLATIPGSSEEKETILLLFARALEKGMSIAGLMPVGFELATALEEGLPIEGVLLEALKGIAQGTPISVIEASLKQRLTLLWEVRDLLFSRGVFRAPPGATPTAPTSLPAARFDELVDQMADALSDYLEGGGGPFDGQTMYALVADRLGKLPESLVRATDVELVLSLIGPADLTRIALAALT